MIGCRRNKTVNCLSQEARICVNKEDHFGKLFLILKDLINLQFRNTIKYGGKRSEKSNNRTTRSEKKKLEDNFKKNDSHNLFKQYVNWKGNLKRALWLLKLKRRIRVQKEKKFLKSRKYILNNISSIRNFLMIKISCNPFLT